MQTLGIVQACFPSSRYRTIAGRKLGGKSLLEWVVRRVTDSMRLQGVIVVASGNAEHRFIRDLVPLDVPVYLGTEADTLARFARAVEQYPAEAVVRVRGDNPFIDPSLIDRLVGTAAAHPNCDYVSYCCRDGRPAILSPVGIYAEWFSVAALRRAERLAKSRADREEVTRYFHAHPERFNLRLIPAPTAIDRDDVRLMVDKEEDWEHALAIVDALGPEALEWQRIANLLVHQPRLRRRMAALNRTG